MDFFVPTNLKISVIKPLIVSQENTLTRKRKEIINKEIDELLEITL